MSEEPATYEHSDISVRAVLYFGLALLISALLIHWIAGAFFASLKRETPSPSTSSRTAQPLFEPPQPRLQTDPQGDLLKWRAAESAALTEYAWVDRAGGVIRIPIEEAMERTLKKGLPARQEAAQKPVTLP